MKSYTENEFYGDFMEFRFEKMRKHFYNFLFRTAGILFMIVFLALVFQRGKANEYLTYAGDFFNKYITDNNRASILGSLGLFVILLPFYTDILHIIRKYGLYPKQSLTQQAFLPVHAKELIIHPRTKNSNGNPKTHYVKVHHPKSGKLVSVDVDGDWFAQLKEGEQVHVHYHPVEGNLLYLRRA